MRKWTALFDLLFLSAFCCAATVSADTYPVTSVDNTGSGSLRQAITDANAHSNAVNPSGVPDIISFAIPGAGVKTINLSSALPIITDPVMIDGTTQSGFAGTPVIELNGGNVGAHGLWINAGGSTVRGLAINGFPRSGIYLTGSGGNTIQGNFVGTDPSGTLARPNGEFGVFIDGPPNNLVGGTQSSARNLVSANTRFSNVAISGSTATNNRVQGNYIGTDVTGTQVLGNSNNGVYIGNSSGVPGSPSNCTVGGTDPGAGNLISGNGNSGVEIYGPNASGNRVQGNYIGTNAAGTGLLGNGADGVNIGDGGGHIIGGTEPGARNIISGNGDGVHIVAYGTAFGATNSVVQGNYIGTDLTGTAALRNTGAGVYLENAGDNSVGGTFAGEGNVISGNQGNGILVTGVAAQDNQISGNLIGRNAADDGALGNGGHGIFLLGSGPNIIGGGFNPDNANTIAHNGGDGVAVVFSGGASIRKGILENSIFSNGGLGIDLEDDGVTPNDEGDGDFGANTLQNFPVLTSASVSGGSTTIQGTLNSTANTNFRIEFFSNEGADPSLYGEGQTFLGATADLTSDANGNLSFNAVLNVTPPAGQTIITATATDSDNDNTSEFSQAIRLAGSGGRLLNIATRLRVQTGENVLIGGFIITGADPKKVMIRGIGPSLSQFFSGVLANPTLELYQGNTLLQANDDWKLTQQPEIEATGIPPTNDLESAIVRTLNPGSHTAILRGAGDGTGIGLVEVYDLAQGANSELANIATRGFVDAGDNVMIGGFIAGGGGGGAVKVLVRAIGPTLTNAGIAGALQNPTLELRDVNGVLIAANDNWKQTQQAEVEATTIPPNDERESAILAILNAGNYTAIVRGEGNTTGVGLVEVYRLQ